MRPSTRSFDRLSVTVAPKGSAPVHVLDFGGRGPNLVLVHGLDGSAANWLDAAPKLTAHHRVIAIDLAGFGRTSLRGHGSSMRAHADLVAAVCADLDIRTASVVGNSMGAVVALELAAARPEFVTTLSLVAPALPRPGHGRVDLGMLGTALALSIGPIARTESARRFAQPAAERVRSLLDSCYASGRRESAMAFEEMVAVADVRTRRDAVHGWSRSARSLWWALTRRRRFHALADRVQAPVQIIAGGADPIIPLASVRATSRRHPNWRVVTLQNVGHVPQLECSDGFVRELLDLTSPSRRQPRRKLA